MEKSSPSIYRDVHVPAQLLTCLTTAAAATALCAYSDKNVKKLLGNTPAKPKILCDNNLRARVTKNFY